MKKRLLVVESPRKRDVIQKWLPDWHVLSTGGHVKKLKGYSSDFSPEYELTVAGKSFQANLKKADFSDVVLATDPDREGEVIAWHVAGMIDAQCSVSRAVVYEITKSSLEKSVQLCRDIDMNLVASQIARSVLDMMIGFGVSRELWRYVGKRASAGRVQTVALREVCDAMRQRMSFSPVVTQRLLAEIDEHVFRVSFGGKNEWSVGESLELPELPFRLEKTTSYTRKISSPLLLNTVDLIRHASRVFSFSASKTMLLAQHLFEGMNGQSFITYTRTDSRRVSEHFLELAKSFFASNGHVFVVPKKHSGLFTQEAHECIRPVSMIRPQDTPLKDDYLKIYDLVWNITLMSLSPDLLVKEERNKMVSGEYDFSVSSFQPVNLKESCGAFDLKYHTMFSFFKSEVQKDMSSVMRSELSPRVYPVTHLSKPSALLTESSLIKSLEEKGIGRPSTYAAILSKLSSREYVEKNSKQIVPTSVGFLVCEEMCKFFPKVFRSEFTAEMEKNLEKIVFGEQDSLDLLRKFEKDFVSDLTVYKDHVSELKSWSIQDECALCKKDCKLIFGRYGPFSVCEQKHLYGITNSSYASRLLSRLTNLPVEEVKPRWKDTFIDKVQQEVVFRESNKEQKPKRQQSRAKQKKSPRR